MSRRVALGFLLVCAFLTQSSAATDPAVQRRVRARISDLEAQLIQIRRGIHEHAEAAGTEETTAETVANFLREHGIEPVTGVGGHGVVAILRGAQPGPTAAYRADMDAMATPAADPEPFKSTNPNVNHVCGHDIHTTVGLAIAAALAPEVENMAGTIKFLFQPAEEIGEGAKAMIDDGALADPVPDAFFAVHCGPMPVGTLFLISGMALPGLEMIEVTITGSGDREAAASHVAEAIRSATTVGDPQGTSVDAWLVPPGTSYAVASVLGAEPDPDTGVLVLTAFMKASDEAAYEGAEAKIRSALLPLNDYKTQIKASFGLNGMPAMVNDPDLCNSSIRAARAVLGEENVGLAEGSIPFFGEDFSYFQKRAPGVLYFLGVANEDKGINGMPHAPDFRADEDAIAVGARAMAAVLWDYLETGRTQ
jgi:metal-dependent amidase/aminoacylase/carboxypeptidase family protein